MGLSLVSDRGVLLLKALADGPVQPAETFDIGSVPCPFAVQQVDLPCPPLGLVVRSRTVVDEFRPASAAVADPVT